MSELYQRPEDAALFYRFPNSPTPGDQVEVGRDEKLVVLRDGALLGSAGPGTHSLDPKSLPFLGRDATGLELWVVCTSTLDGVQAGGRLGDILDSASQVRCAPMVHLEYALAVTDAAKLVLACNGGMTESERLLPWVGGQVVGGVRDALAMAVERDHLSLGSPELVGRLIQGAKGATSKLESSGLAIADVADLRLNFSDEDVAAMRAAMRSAAAKHAAPVTAAMPTVAALRCSRCGKSQSKGKFCADCGGALQA